MKINIILTLLGLFVLDGASAQNTNLDSLSSQVERLFISDQIDKAIPFAKNGEKMALVSEDSSYIVHFNYMLSKLYRLRGHVDSAINCLSFSLSYVSSVKDQRKINNQLGEILLEIGAYKSSIPYLKSLVNNDGNLSHKFYNLNLLGRAYLGSGQYSQAVLNFKEQLLVAEKLNKTHFLANASNNIGFAYTTNGNYKNAKNYYIKSIAYVLSKETINARDTVILINVYQNLGGLYYLTGNIDEAENYYEKSLALIPNWHTSNAFKVLDFEIYLKTLLRLKKYNALKYLLPIYEKKAQKISERLFVSNFKVEFYAKTHQNSKLIIEIHRFNKLLKRKNENDLSQTVKYTEMIGDFYLKSAQLNQSISEANKKMAIQKERNRALFFIFLCVFVIIISGFGYYIYRSRQKRLLSEQLLLKKEKENLKISLELKKKDLSNVAIDISQRNEEIEAFLQKFKGIQSIGAEEVKEKLLNELRVFKNFIASKTTLNQFLENNDIVNSEFYKKLTTKHPNLTQYEIELCSYFLINLSTKDIANIRGISPQSVRMNKMRLKKKLKIKNKDLIQYLKSI